jgi:hypothetical protein
VPPDDAWTLPAPHDQCTRCEAELAVGASVTVALTFDAEGPRRDDLCTGCGESVQGKEDVFYWRTTRPDAESSRPVVDYAFLREMFSRMLQRPEPVYRGLAYLVGLILVRKRHLRLKGFESREDGEVMLVTRGAGEPEMDVPAPHLSAEAMVETRERLKRLLAADLPDGPDPLDPAAFVVDDGQGADAEAPVGEPVGESGADEAAPDESHPELN